MEQTFEYGQQVTYTDPKGEVHGTDKPWFVAAVVVRDDKAFYTVGPRGKLGAKGDIGAQLTAVEI